MFINNLQLWLSSGLFSLINIDQETILDFLNIDRPFNNEDYSYLVGASTITTPVSFETSKLIIQSIWAHYQHGLGFVDIENIALFILFVRQAPPLAWSISPGVVRSYDTKLSW